MRRIRPRPRFWFLLTGVMVLTFLCSGAASQYRYQRNLARLQQLHAEKLCLEESVARLHAQLEYTGSDAWVERTARKELNMIYPHEIRYVLGE